MLIRVAFLVSSPELQGWIEGEADAYPYAVSFDAEKPADAYVVLAEREGDRQFLAHIPEGTPFAWYGDYADAAGARNPRFLDGDWDSFTGESLVEAARVMAEEIEAQKKTARRPRLLKNEEIHEKSEEPEDHQKEPSKPRLSWKSRRNERQPEELEKADDLSNAMKPAVISQVIAVGGTRGGGASFVAWNLAAVTGIPLLEGRTTGALSKWTGDQTPVMQAVQTGSNYGTVLEGELPREVLAQRVIVDTGDDLHHPLFKQAAIRIWVTSLDPAVIFVPSAACLVVVNRVPEWMAIDLREVVKADVALQVPDGGWEALLSLYTHMPWILKQPQEVKEAWRRLIEPARAKKEEASWDIGW